MRFAWFVVEPNREQLIQVGELIDAGKLRPIIDAVFPLSQARQAYEQGIRAHAGQGCPARGGLRRLDLFNCWPKFKERNIPWNSRLFIAQQRSMESPSSIRGGPKDAPTLLLLHGLPSSSRMFEPLFARLSDRYHLVAPDYPGFGHSDWPDPKQFPYTFDHCTEIIGHFTETLKLSRYTLYMQDYGGPVGFRMALVHRKRSRLSSCRMQ